MKVKKAVITLAGPDQRKLPLQFLIDREGNEKSVLEFLLDEIKLAGIEKIGIVHYPGDNSTYCNFLGKHADEVTFIVQNETRGYAHAIYCAAKFTAKEPFLHLVGDHLYVNRDKTSAAKHIIEIAEKENCSVSSVQPTRESLITHFGVVGGHRIQGSKDLYKIDKVIEKPTPTEAEQKLLIPGLRAGHYLCFFGMHVLTDTIMVIIEELLKANPERRVNLSEALNLLALKEEYIALEKNDLRYDLGTKYGLLKAQLAVALNGKDRDQLMSELVEFFVAKDLNQVGK